MPAVPRTTPTSTQNSRPTSSVSSQSSLTKKDISSSLRETRGQHQDQLGIAPLTDASTQKDEQDQPLIQNIHHLDTPQAFLRAEIGAQHQYQPDITPLSNAVIREEAHVIDSEAALKPKSRDEPSLLPETTPLDIIDTLQGRRITVDYPAELGNTPLHYAVNRKDKDEILRLLKAGADPYLPNDDGETPMSRAIHDKWPSYRILKLQLRGEEPDPQQKAHLSALHFALLHDDWESIPFENLL